MKNIILRCLFIFILIFPQISLAQNSDQINYSEKPWLNFSVPEKTDKQFFKKYFRINLDYYIVAYEEKENTPEEKITTNGKYINFYLVQPISFINTPFKDIWKLVVDVWTYDAEKNEKRLEQIIIYCDENHQIQVGCYDYIVEDPSNLVKKVDRTYIKDKEDFEKLTEYFEKMYLILLNNFDHDLY